MDTRLRRRKRGRKSATEESNPSQISESRINQNAASLPECRPAASRAPNKASLVTPATTPRQYSSCTRLSRGRSPSPARISRQREQSELQRLNSRLSTYADSVRHLQAENARLRLQSDTMDDVIKRETGTIKQLHELEVKSLQELLDKCYEDKSQLESQCEDLKAENDRLTASLQGKSSEVVSLQEKAEAYKSLSTAFHQLQAEYERTSVLLQESQQDVDRLSAELVKEKRSNKRLEDEAKFNKDRYLKEVEEASARFSQHMHQTDQKLEKDYETMVTDALASVREQHIRDLESLRSELTSTYQSKLTEWKSKCELAQADLISVRREVKVTKQEHDKLRDNVTQLKAVKAALQVELSETYSRLEELKEISERDRCQSQREVALLSQELAEVKEELDEMGGANSRLEAEIVSYRLIVEELEGQTPTKNSDKRRGQQTDSVTDSPSTDAMSYGTLSKNKKKRKKDKQGGWKKKETTDVLSLTAKHDFFRTNEYSQGIDILEVDVTGRYITLINTTDHPADLALWSVIETDHCGNRVKYEISQTSQVPRGKRLTIWSCETESGVGTREEDTLDPEGESMYGIQLTMPDSSWFRLDQQPTVRVEDGDGQLQAKCEFNTFKESPETKRSRLLPITTKSMTAGVAVPVATSPSSTSHAGDDKATDGAAVFGSSSFACGDAADIGGYKNQKTGALRDKDQCSVM